ERRSYPTFVSSAQFDAIEWIAAHVPPDAAVTLCSLQSGVLIPPYAGGRVVLGHWAESYRAAQREKDVKKFFDSATSDDWRAEFVGQHRIGYLLWGRFEKALGDYDPSKEGNIWRIAWKNEEITIFHRADQP
ncbi:hypothetical protein HYR69_00770, partial [Candidatus Sumerlaeota bacterium]|nr:hypothetical protein [Candidatus Sumerlaeota bacterium]